MDFSGEDVQLLLTLQQVAGFLNLSVDELLRLRRSPTNPAGSGPASRPQQLSGFSGQRDHPGHAHHSPLETAGQHPDVTLLNPESQHAWFKCNMDYEMIKPGDISGSDEYDSSDTDGYVVVAPKTHDPDAESESTARDEAIESADEMALSVTSNRSDTNLTRSLNACVRCRIQRNRVG